MGVQRDFIFYKGGNPKIARTIAITRRSNKLSGIYCFNGNKYGLATAAIISDGRKYAHWATEAGNASSFMIKIIMQATNIFRVEKRNSFIFACRTKSLQITFDLILATNFVAWVTTHPVTEILIFVIDSNSTRNFSLQGRRVGMAYTLFSGSKGCNSNAAFLALFITSSLV